MGAPRTCAQDTGGARPREDRRTPDWPRRVAAVALVVCGAMYLPLRQDGASLPVRGFGVAVFALCLVLAAGLLLRGAVPLLVAAVLVPSALAALELLDGLLHSTSLSQALDIAAAPPWAAGAASAATALVALAALLVALATGWNARRPAPPRAAKPDPDRVAR